MGFGGAVGAAVIRDTLRARMREQINYPLSSFGSKNKLRRRRWVWDVDDGMRLYLSVEIGTGCRVAAADLYTCTLGIVAFAGCGVGSVLIADCLLCFRL